jgi:hypothetical protein
MSIRDLLAEYAPIDGLDGVTAYLRLLAERASDRIEESALAKHDTERIARGGALHLAAKAMEVAPRR